MAGIRWRDKRRMNQRSMESMYPICSKFAICSFRGWGTGPFPSPAKCSGPFWFLDWSLLGAPSVEGQKRYGVLVFQKNSIDIVSEILICPRTTAAAEQEYTLLPAAVHSLTVP